MIRGVDLDAWLRARVGITNEDGGRGYERGVRTCDCPLCDDSQVGRARGWLNVLRGWAGCLNAGCPVEGGMPALEYVRQVEGLRTRTEALVLLRAQFPGTGWEPPPPAAPAAYDDWCVLPESCELLPALRARRQLADQAGAFLRRQWGISAGTAERFGLRFCVRGRYAWRIIIPVVMGGRLVAFQARSYRNGEPKYLTSAWGKRDEPGAECGRPAEALLFNLDAVREGSDVVLIEGAGDVMRLAAGDEHRGIFPAVRVGGAAVALLGTALTDEKAALLAAKKPGRVIVALDTEAEEQAAKKLVAKAGEIVEVLHFWGMDAAPGRWDGGKDAGSGARLVVDDNVGSGLGVRAARRMGL